MMNNVIRLGVQRTAVRISRSGCAWPVASPKLFALELRTNKQIQKRKYTGYDYYDQPSKFLVERNDPGADSRIIYLRHPTTGTEYFIVGTAHISEQSAEEARDVIEKVRPDTVMVELDETRAIKIKQEVHLHDKDFVIKQLSPIEHNKASGFASFFSGDLLTNLLTKFYSYLRDLGFVPGKEFAVAMEEAEKINANILLGDRSVAATRHSLSRSAGFMTLLKGFLKSSSDPEARELRELMLDDLDMQRDTPPTNEALKDHLKTAVEKLKNRRRVRKVTAILDRNCPEVSRALLHERDLYMINALHHMGRNGAQKVVGVVGLAHLDGIEKHWTRLKERKKELNMKRDDLEDWVVWPKSII
jgi:pheromone shutdown protein TraB